MNVSTSRRVMVSADAPASAIDVPMAVAAHRQ